MANAITWRLLHLSSMLECPFNYYSTSLLSRTSKFVHASASTSTVFPYHCHWKSAISVRNSASLLKKTPWSRYCTTASSWSESDTTQSGNEPFPFEGHPSRKKRIQDLGKALRSLNAPTEHKVQKNDDVDGDRFYNIVSEDGSEYSFPSVTTILGRTLPSKNYYSLKNWKRNVIKEVGEEGYKMVRLKATSGGSSLHRCVEHRLAEEAKITPISIRPNQRPGSPSLATPTHLPPVPLAGSTSLALEEQRPEGKEPEESLCKDPQYLKSLEHVLKDISEVYALESVVSHLELGYSGTVDCIGRYKGENCVIDWKTSSRPKPSLDDCFDFPLQVVAYAGAINQDKHYPFKVYNALIVVAYPSGEPAHAHFLTHKQCKCYWQQWLARLEEFHTQFAHDLSNVYL